MDDFEKTIGSDGDMTADTFSLDDILNEFGDEALMGTEDESEYPDESVSFEVPDDFSAVEISSEEPAAQEEISEEENESPREEPHIDDYDVVKSYKPVNDEDLDELLSTVKMQFITDEEPRQPEVSDDGQEPQFNTEYATADAADEEPEYVEPQGGEERERPEKSFGQRAVSPFLALMAMISLKNKQRRATVKAAPPEEAEDLGPEMDAEKASRYYGSNIKDLRLRTKIALGLCLVLMYISFGLPVFGSLKTVAGISLMCLILELSVVVVCLDVFTAGIMDLVRKKPGAGSLIAISCILSAIDAVIIAITKDEAVGLPFCAVSALSITCALWASLAACKANRITLRTLALSKSAYAVTAESGVVENEVTLLKSQTGTENFVRRTEETAPDEEVYSTLAPWVMIAALVLAAIATIISKDYKNFAHILTAIFLPAAPLSALLSFPLPYSYTARKLFRSGSAVAGWSGLYDIGGSKQIIITDTDIFPRETVSIESIRILEGTLPSKLISYAGSVIAASGSGLAPVFTELMEKNNCPLEHVDEFCCNEGGGLTAMINGEEVLCGNSGFMRLMGIRLPQKLASRSSVFVAINGMITAIFTINYTPVVTVQRALVSLLHGRRRPIFAIRDFNITPEMIRYKFRMPTDGFDFPSFAKRYEISSTQRSADSKVAAIVSRQGLAPLVELSEEGHRLYFVVRMCVVLSVLCTIVGMIMMFFLCLTGAFDSVSAQNLLIYMLFWLLPEIALVFGLRR